MTHTNWEGTGVEPDVKVPAEDALRTAHVAALTALKAKATDDERRAALDRAIAFAQNLDAAPGPGPRRAPGR
jgi:C-terminal processing protease CtpA/Prc